jgi:hypothetical protein
MHASRHLAFAAGWVTSLGLCAALGLAEPPRDKSPAWAEALLDQVKLTPAKAQLDPNRWTGGGQFRLDTFQRLWDDWRQVDPTARTAAREFLAASANFDALTATAAPLIDVKPLPIAPARQPEGKEPTAAEALSRAVVGLHSALERPLTAEQKKDLDTRVKTVPTAVARAAALLLEAMPGALKKRQQALAKVGGPDKLQAAYDRARDLAVDYAVDAETLRLMRDVDLTALVQGGQELARAMDQASAVLVKVPTERFEFAWDTPIGAVALNGTQDNVYGAGPYLLIIDTGGNDRYASGGATTSAAHPISLLLDLAGDDVYETKAGPAFGAGILGYGFLLDAGGNDVYRADCLACGMASFGVGVLLDRGGKDRYEIDRVGQGAAFFGVGVLSDLKGDDEYHCFQQAQGFGGTRGVRCPGGPGGQRPVRGRRQQDSLPVAADQGTQHEPGAGVCVRPPRASRRRQLVGRRRRGPDRRERGRPLQVRRVRAGDQLLVRAGDAGGPGGARHL